MEQIVLTSFLIFGCVLCASENEVRTYHFAMPNIHPHRDEIYLCTPMRIPPAINYYIVGFEANATMHIAHHVVVYGCTDLATNDSVWICGGMLTGLNETDDTYKIASSCGSGAQIIYAWARDAPSLHLPTDVGFHIGKDSPIKYLVLQVHYMHRFPPTKTDNSGVFIQYTTEKMRRQAGIIILGAHGVIAPKKVEHMETAYTIEEDKIIYPFAFRPHTHGLGKLVTGYVVRHNESGDDKWTLLGTKDPQLPHMFYPVVNTAPFTRGDVLAARCVINNTHSHAVKTGHTFNDEMCNFYLMYWVENDTPLKRKKYFSAGPPSYYWTVDNFTNIPVFP